jgi:hypothetical protein
LFVQTYPSDAARVNATPRGSRSGMGRPLRSETDQRGLSDQPTLYATVV